MSKGDATCWTTSQNPPRWHPSWPSDVCATRKDPESECLARDKAKTNPITIKPKTVSHVAEQSPGFPHPPALRGRPFPVKSLPLTARVPPWTVHFQTLDKSPLSALEGVPPSCNSTAGYLILGELAGRASHFEQRVPISQLLRIPAAISMS